MEGVKRLLLASFESESSGAAASQTCTCHVVVVRDRSFFLNIMNNSGSIDLQGIQP